MNIDIINTNKDPLAESINKEKENKEENSPQTLDEEVNTKPIEESKESKPVGEEKVNKDNNVKEQIHIKMDSTMYQPAFNIEDDGILELENK